MIHWKARTLVIHTVGRTSDPRLQATGRGVFVFTSLLDYLQQPQPAGLDELIIDLTKIGWVSLFDWWSFTTLLHKTLADNQRLKISLDFIGPRPSGLIPYTECADYVNERLKVPLYNKDDYLQSYVVHRLIQFIKAIEGPTGFSDVGAGRLVLRFVLGQYAARRGWYRKDPGIEKSVIFPRTNVATAEMCRLFASRKGIEAWRRAMAENRIPDAAVFQSEEFWRIVCHELARNVYEHAEGIGFLTARIVESEKGNLPIWCKSAYDEHILKQLNGSKECGFLEICVCDAGFGIPATIRDAFCRRHAERNANSNPIEEVADEDLIKFAFDELGTRKDDEHSWITDRHALSHILLIAKKYKGTVCVRSGRASLTYCPKGASLLRCKNQLGYEPQDMYGFDRASASGNLQLLGTHIQIIIPLSPTPRVSKGTPSAQLTRHLPTSFNVDLRHPLGPLLPVRDMLGAVKMGIRGDDQAKFKKACRTLAASLLQGVHPREEVLIFDFAEIDWSPAQFETFLYLFQNVLVGRPTLFTNIAAQVADLVCAQEQDIERATYLTTEMKEEIHQRSLEREFTEGLFLETYSGIGIIVLGLGPDSGEYIFGVRDAKIREALLALVRSGPRTARNLAEEFAVEEMLLSNVLSGATSLFRMDEHQVWDTIWPTNVVLDDGSTVSMLEVQRQRSITHNFISVVASCGAWLGINNDAGLRPQRFYLPTEDAIYMKFFESSRILSRDRYVTEIAQRLIYRVCTGLDQYCAPPLKVAEVDILACSTTPSVMLAEAIRRAWPVEHNGQRPVIIDYGPSLFAGADPAHIPNLGRKTRAIVIQDVFDEGTLSQRVVELVERRQSGDVLFVLSFVRFVSPDELKNGDPTPFGPNDGWNVNEIVGKRVHALIALPRPIKVPKSSIDDWGASDGDRDYVVDPRSLRPVALRTLRLESMHSEARSLTKRDACLEALDNDGDTCRLAAGHFVYGHRHFAVVVDVRSLLTGAIGHRIVSWLGDVCCNVRRRTASWESKRLKPVTGDVSVLLLPLHSQIHYILPNLQFELAQRGRRVPHFFLDATSFGGGLLRYEVPHQLKLQISNAAKAIKKICDMRTGKDIEARVTLRRLRIMVVDDAIFSARTVQSLLDSIAQQCDSIKRAVYMEHKYPEPIEWIRVFCVLNQMPAAQSELWHELQTCRAAPLFRFDEYAPFIGAATFSAADCPICREEEHLEYVERRLGGVSAHAVQWIRERREKIVGLTTEAPSFRKKVGALLPAPIDVLALARGAAQQRYKPMYADSAIWRFYELMYLSYPLADVLPALRTSRELGNLHEGYRGEYARFRGAIYDWCIRHWHQVRIYNLTKQVLHELMAEVEGGERLFIDVIYRLDSIMPDEDVSNFVKWAVDLLATRDANSTKVALNSTLNLDTALTQLFYAARDKDLRATGLLDYLRNKQATVLRKSNFLSLLYLGLTRPRSVADPAWALTTIAEICFRGRVGDDQEARRTTDHDLLGRIVSETARVPNDPELRRRLEGALHVFIAAAENLKPYFDDDLLASVVDASRKVLIWLHIPVSEATTNTQPIHDLDVTMQDKATWQKFAQCCHMAVEDFEEELRGRFRELRNGGDRDAYMSSELEVAVCPEVQKWCLMTHIPHLLAFLSNIAVEPAKTKKQSHPSVITFRRSAEHTQSIEIEVVTNFGPPEDARRAISASPKISRNRADLEKFGVRVLLCSAHALADKLKILLIIPVGFQPNKI